jgi:hypothetical protein
VSDGDHHFLLVLEDGVPAEPAAFVSDRANWEPGDTLMAGGRRFRVLDKQTDVAEVTAHVFEAILTVEELPS